MGYRLVEELKEIKKLLKEFPKGYSKETLAHFYKEPELFLDPFDPKVSPDRYIKKIIKEVKSMLKKGNIIEEEAMDYAKQAVNLAVACYKLWEKKSGKKIDQKSMQKGKELLSKYIEKLKEKEKKKWKGLARRIARKRNKKK